LFEEDYPLGGQRARVGGNSLRGKRKEAKTSLPINEKKKVDWGDNF